MKLITKSIIASLALCSWATAQIEAPAIPTIEERKVQFSSIKAPGESGNIGSHAQIKVHENQFFLGGGDTAKLMKSYGNLPSSYDGAIVANDESYLITFLFNDSGYVKDDEKEELDAAEILATFKASDEEGNKQRKAAGLDTLTTVGWAFEPRYNETTNNLESALILQSGDGSQTVNHKIQILGRKGYIDAVLLCDPSQLEALRPMLDETLAGFEYNAGNKYAEFQEGDKIAEYGLKGLLIGGGLLAAGKLGLFALLGKFLKPIGLGIVAVGAGIVKFKDKIFGSKKA